MREIAGVPRVPPGAITRPRLLALLDRQPPLTVLRGGSGLGKTTLLAQWVASRPVEATTTVWLTLDPTVQTRAGFWVRVLGALHRAGVIGDAALYRESAAVADDGGHAGAAIQRVLTDTGDVRLILDDFGGAEPFWAEICHDLTALLRHQPTLRCVVAGPVETLLEGPAVAAALATEVIAEDVLAPTADEVDAIDRSGGPVARPAVGTGRGWDVAAWLGDPRLAEFVSVAALAPYLDQRLADEFAGGADAGPLLARLARDGIGHWSSAGDGAAVFRLGEHIRMAASAQLGADHPDRVPATLSRVARWLADERGDAAGGVEYALRAGDLDLADRLMVWAYPLSHEDHRHLALMLEGLPGAGFADYPFLALTYAVYLNSHEQRRSTAAEYFAAAAEASRRRTARASSADRVIIHGLQTGVYRLLGQRRRMVEAARWTIRGLAAARSEPIDPGHGQAMALAIGQAATSLLAAEDLPGAAAAFEALAGFAAERRWSHFGNLAASGTAIVAVLEGRFAAARSALADVRPGAWPAPWYRGYEGALRALAQAWVNLDGGDPEAALSELALLAPHERTIEYWDILGTAKAIAKAMMGQSGSAALELAQLRRQRETAATLPAVLVRLSIAESVLHLAGGTPADPAGLAAPITSGASRRALRAISSAARGETERALAHLARAEASAQTPIQEALAVVAGAILAHRVSPQLSAAVQGRRLATMVTSYGLRWPLVLLAMSDREHLLTALAEGGDGSAHDALTASFAAVPPIVGETLWDGGHAPVLTKRERQVLLALADTGRRAEIAERLFVSTNTVKAQLRSVYGKLGAHSREEALARAITLGLLHDKRR